MSLGKNLQALLKRRKLEQKELAKKLGLAPSSVSDWVTGKTHPRHKHLVALADVLETTVARLVA